APWLIRGVKDRNFTAQVYQLLLRAYIGTREGAQDNDQVMKKVRKILKILEVIASDDDSGDITQIYEELSRSMRKEIESLEKLNKTKELEKTREDLKWMLDELFQRKNDLTEVTLYWIANMYFGLAEGQRQSDATAAKSYYQSAAAAFEEILKKDGVQEERKFSATLRIVKCLRHAEKFEQALERIKQVLDKHDSSPVAQIEAAYTLHQWGIKDKSASRLDLAISGGFIQIVKDKVTVFADKKKDMTNAVEFWGWNGISTKLDLWINSDDLNDDDLKQDFKEKYILAQFRIPWIRLNKARLQSGDKKNTGRIAALGDALRDILDFATGFNGIHGKTVTDMDLSEDLNATPWGTALVKQNNEVNAQALFEKLYENVQREMGRTGNDLETIRWPAPKKKETAVAKLKTNGDPPKNKDPLRPDEPEKKQKSNQKKADSSPLPMIAGILIIVVGLGGGGWYLYKTTGKQKKPRRVYAGISGTVSFDSFPSPTRQKPAAKRKPASQGKRPTAAQSKGAVPQKPGSRPRAPNRPPQEKRPPKPKQ
ncbi:MAG: hypothetical protein IID45_08920, partial [Planctomycetes bacterium]|nr:hypothetical protein [Planctomycetota bacterium]